MRNSVLIGVGMLLASVTMAYADNTFWKAGVPQDAMIDDQVECSAIGNQSAPPDRVGTGYDRNFELRMRIVGQCMKKKGYQAVKVKSCGPFKGMPDTTKPVKITAKTCVKGISYAYVFVN